MRGLAAAVVVAGVVAGCVTVTPRPPASVDVTGRWEGLWLGSGAGLIPREEETTLDLVQAGARGTGRLIMQGALAAHSVPDVARDSGLTGMKVLFDVSGNRVRLWHELGGDYFEAELVVLGDRMVGHALGADPPVRFDLARQKPRVAAAPPAVEPPRVPAPMPLIVMAPAPPVEAVPPPPPETAPPPRREAPLPAEFSPTTGVRTINFDFDRAEIRPGDAAILDANADWLRVNPDRLVLIEGHCDERGTAEYNLALGERRAQAAKAYLLARGIAETRMTVTSYGFERPLCRDHAESCWSRNRRAEFLIK
jgi:peptidoglycan-associated lipoprotein